MNHLDAGHQLEQLAGHMMRRPDAGGGEIDLAGVGFRIRYEIRQRPHRKRGIYLDDEGRASEARNRSDVPRKHEIELLIECRIDGVR